MLNRQYPPAGEVVTWYIKMFLATSFRLKYIKKRLCDSGISPKEMQFVYKDMLCVCVCGLKLIKGGFHIRAL